MTASLRRLGPERDRREDKPHLYALDALRLLCALAVAGFHFGATSNLDGVHSSEYHLPVASHVLVYGAFGVEFFFMISGFVICMSSWGRGLGDFFISRVTRIYPAFWVCVLLTTVLVDLLPAPVGVPLDVVDLPPHDLALNLTMLAEPLGVSMADPVYWTLWVEMRFYLLFALVTWRGLTYRRATLFCVLYMAAAIVAAGSGNQLLTTLMVPHLAQYFVAGIALYLMYRFGPSPLLSSIIGFCWLVSVYQVYHRPAFFDSGFPVPTWPTPLIITVAYVVMIVIARGWTDRLTWRWLAVAGALTYPFYLLHLRIGHSLTRAAHDRTGWPAEALIIGTIAVVLVLAWLVHRFVERPLMPAMRSALRRSLNEGRKGLLDGAAVQAEPPGVTMRIDPAVVIRPESASHATHQGP